MKFRGDNWGRYLSKYSVNLYGFWQVSPESPPARINYNNLRRRRLIPFCPMGTLIGIR